MSADILLTHFNQLFYPNDLGHPLYGKPIDEYKGKCTAAKAMQVMICLLYTSRCV